MRTSGGKPTRMPEQASSPVRAGRRPDGIRDRKPVETVITDFWPKWHAGSGTLLGTGQGAEFVDDQAPLVDGRRTTAFSRYDAESHAWSKWDVMRMPLEEMQHSCGAGCAQRVDLPNGEILLPVYFCSPGSRIWRARVLRCRFDGTSLAVVEAGNTMSVESHRGLAEPSLAVFRGKYYLTLRHDLTAYVAVSDDGLHFGPIREWKWDDGADLGSYNTQAHWVTHSDGLFLVYTRRGADNDHIFRHRAPLFMAEVDLATLRVKRATERILIPQRGARYGNFGVCDVSPHETWVVETEWMQRPPEEPIIAVDNRWGASARVFVARILWSEPNHVWDRH
jgi:hypothetical protein